MNNQIPAVKPLKELSFNLRTISACTKFFFFCVACCLAQIIILLALVPYLILSLLAFVVEQAVICVLEKKYGLLGGAIASFIGLGALVGLIAWASGFISRILSGLSPDDMIQLGFVVWSTFELMAATVILFSIFRSGPALRFKGVNERAFPFVLCMAFIICLGSGAEFIATITGAPISTDFFIWIIVLVSCLLIWSMIWSRCPKLKSREVLLALGLSIPFFLPQRVAVKPLSNNVSAGVATVGNEAIDFFAFSRLGKVLNTSQLGIVGETVTIRYFRDVEGLSYINKLKLPSNQGFDAVFETVRNGRPLLYVVEAKANTAGLAKGQMTDDWIRKTCQKMMGPKCTTKQRVVAKRILNALKLGELQKVLSKVDVNNESITWMRLDKDAKVIGGKFSDVITNIIQKAKVDILRGEVY